MSTNQRKRGVKSNCMALPVLSLRFNEAQPQTLSAIICLPSACMVPDTRNNAPRFSRDIIIIHHLCMEGDG